MACEVVKPTYPDHTVTITQGIGGQLNPSSLISIREVILRDSIPSISYPRAVLPQPGGPQISVTWPRFTPPLTAASCESAASPSSARSRASSPVEM
ncbi:hypothetical protein CCMA1212_004515 [Trichoderma ghanense]|uniref:Uncharacterized protein n=1 Tax=Trichoderma ghanense TaxID=65468 RepID=A0ABY2H4A1_9HYPO